MDGLAGTGFAYIYKIECIKNGRVYVGQTINFDGRIKCHIQQLRRHKHRVKLMQEDFDRYGELAFVPSVIKKAPERCVQCADGMPRRISSIEEKEMMLRYKSYLPEFGYNYKDQYFYPHGGKRKMEALWKNPNDFMEVG